MPEIVDPRDFRSTIEIGETHDYSYPMGLNLRPGTKVHDLIVSRVMQMVRESHREISSRYASWDKVDETLNAYSLMDAQDKKEKREDSRRPVSVVIPISFAILDTLLTQLVTTFADGPLFHYAGVGPEDQVPAMLAEMAIDVQSRRNKVLLALYTQWRDAMAYGLGVVSPRWHTHYGKRLQKVEESFPSAITELPVVTGVRREMGKREVIFEGNTLDNVDVRHYFPDPGVPCHKIQDGDYVAWLSTESYLGLLGLERDKEGVYFNVKYLKERYGVSRYNYTKKSDLTSLPTVRDGSKQGTHPIDVIMCYANIIPKEWKVGKSEYPEKWLFCIASDSVVIRAQPCGLLHDLFPVAVCAPTFDGYGIAPISTLEVVRGQQEGVDWLYRSHIHNIRKSLNNMLIVDPWLVNYADVVNQEPGKAIRIREHVWGRGVKDAVEQLSLVDVTRDHLPNIAHAIDVIQRVTGAVDSLQGITRQGGERRSATEMRDTRLSALSRVQKSARIIAVQSMQDIGHMFVSHLQQFSTKSMYLQLVGRYKRELQKHFPDQEGVEVDPLDFVAEIDFIPSDGSSPGGEFLPDLIQLYQLTVNNPVTFQAFDSVRMLLDIYRRAGVRYPGEWLTTKVVSDEQAMALAAQQQDVNVGGNNAQLGQQLPRPVG